MVVFTLSCFGLLLFLWLSFGGSIPLRPKSYRVEVAFPEAATLAQEADVRHGRREHRQGEEEAARQGRRADDRRARDRSPSTPRSPRTRRRSCARRRSSARPTCELSPGHKGVGHRARTGADLPTGRWSGPRSWTRSSRRSTSRRARRSRIGCPSSPRRSSITRPVRPRTSTTRSGTSPGFAVDGAKLPEDARRAGGSGPPSGQEHRRRVRRDQRAPGRAARPDPERQQRLRGHPVPRRGAGRDLLDLPDLPRRVQGHAGAARALLAQRPPAHQRPQGPRG